MRVVEERRALAGLAIEVDAGRGVEAAGAEVDALAAGVGAQRAEGDADFGAAGVEDGVVGEAHVARRGREALGRIGEAVGGELREAPLDLLAGVDRGGAVEVGARREAAVGEVLLFFSVRVGISRTRSGSRPNSSATSWRIFVFTPWPISVPPVETCTVPSV